MKRYYVTLIDGQVVHKPMEIGTNHSDSPNIYWSEEQMKLNNFVEVDVTYDPVAESIDIDSPIIGTDTVAYNRNPRQASQILSISRKRRMDQIQNQADSIILTKYPLMKLIYVALGSDTVLAQQIRDDITTIVKSLRQAKINLDALTKRNEIEAYTHTFPII